MSVHSRHHNNIMEVDSSSSDEDVLIAFDNRPGQKTASVTIRPVTIRPTMVDISRALGAIPGEFGAALQHKILEKRVDGDQLIVLLNSVEVKAQSPVPAMDVFCALSHLLCPFLDRVSWNSLRITNHRIHLGSVPVRPPWPQLVLRVGSPVNSVSFSPVPPVPSSAKNLVACGSQDGIITVWNRTDGECTILVGHIASVSCVSFSPNGKILASGSHDLSIRLWDLDDNSHRRLMGHHLPINDIAFSPTRPAIASCSDGIEEVHIWDTVTAQLLSTTSLASAPLCVPTRRPFPCMVAFSPDGSSLLIGGEAISVWDVDADVVVWSVGLGRRHHGHSNALAYSPTGLFVASTYSNSVQILGASDGRLEKSLQCHSLVSALCFSTTGNLFASGYQDGTVRLWAMNDPYAICCLAVSPHCHVADPEDEDYDDDDQLSARVTSLAFSPDGQTLASCGVDGHIFLWDTRFCC